MTPSQNHVIKIVKHPSHRKKSSFVNQNGRNWHAKRVAARKIQIKYYFTLAIHTATHSSIVTCRRLPAAGHFLSLLLLLWARKYGENHFWLCFNLFIFRFIVRKTSATSSSAKWWRDTGGIWHNLIFFLLRSRRKRGTSGKLVCNETSYDVGRVVQIDGKVSLEKSAKQKEAWRVTRWHYGDDMSEGN